MKTLSLILPAALLIAGCNSEIRVDTPEIPQTLRFTFQDDNQGWQAGFSDFTPALEADFELVSGVRTVPGTDNERGFYLAGSNRSDDLFMYITSRFRGLQRSTRYLADLDVDFVTDAGTDCIGIGGAPGESVFVKFGFAETQPEQLDYYLNVDKGNQSQGGTNANVVGNIAVPDLPCDGSELGRKSLQTSINTRLEFTTTEDGRIWLFLGTDSGYEGRSQIYFTNLEITVRPR